MNGKKVVTALGFIALGVGTVSLFWKQSAVLSFLLVALTYIKEKVFPVKGALRWFVIVGVLGPTMEGCILWLGGNPWTYASPALFNVPLWLAPLYGFAGIILVTLYQGVLNSK